MTSQTYSILSVKSLINISFNEDKSFFVKTLQISNSHKNSHKLDLTQN